MLAHRIATTYSQSNSGVVLSNAACLAKTLCSLGVVDVVTGTKVKIVFYFVFVF